MGKVEIDINVGDRVRSHDFPDRYWDDGEDPQCYAEGIVEEITDPKTHARFRDCPRYVIRVERHIFQGKVVEHDELIYPPVNNVPKLFGGFTNGVIVVERAASREGEVSA